jgi:hypothetical protein
MVKIMKTSSIVVSTMAAVLLSSAGPLLAQGDSPKMIPVELFACSWRDGKNMADLDKVNGRFNKWVDKNVPGYTAWVITPQFRAMEGEFDVGWIGSWADGMAMGKFVSAFTGGDHGLGQAYDEVVDCSGSHVLMSSLPVMAPDGPPDDGVVLFSSCTLAEGGSAAAAVKAHGELAGKLKSMGMKSSSWIFYPALGFGEAKYDYMSVVGFTSYEDLGEGFEIMANKGGLQERDRHMEGVASCDSSRAYDARLVRRGS